MSLSDLADLGLSGAILLPSDPDLADQRRGRGWTDREPHLLHRQAEGVGRSQHELGENSGNVPQISIEAAVFLHERLSGHHVSEMPKKCPNLLSK